MRHITRVSNKFKLEVLKARIAGRTQYRLAQDCDPPLHPQVLSNLISGARPVHDNDPRIIAVGKLLGLKAADCFETGSERR